MATLSCDPASLVAAATCFRCVPREMQVPVELYSLAVAAGGSTDPATLAKCFKCLTPDEREIVRIYLLCVIAGGT